ncbi:hypothetical protein TSAR_013196 [Trichomalopsis sarcophagae]|uniref:Uncharacterized protein n=1 Tax=Trichomalopsis sarcophagae TaxID=543379 RepID=A0A232FBV3_9HYME|nr:hypothetical protein TSAR_013196 [Trichomalopsis sarcophagae]
MCGSPGNDLSTRIITMATKDNFSVVQTGYAQYCGGETELNCHQQCGGPPYTCSKGFFSNEYSCICGNEDNLGDLDPLEFTEPHVPSSNIW